MTYCYDYPRPAVTVDLALFVLAEEGLRTLLIRRKKAPFAGHWALPGGFLEIDEPIIDGARRELQEETGLVASGIVEPIGVFGAPGRDPRGRTISLAHASTVRGPLPAVAGGDDASTADWLDPRGIDGLAFDHDEILRVALAWLARRVEEGPAGLGLLPESFGDEEIKAMRRGVFGSARGALGWRRRMEKLGQIRVDPETERRFRAIC